MPSYKQKKQRLRNLVKAEQEQRIKKIQEEGYQFKKTDAFRVTEKHYKYYVHVKTDYSKIVDPQQFKVIEMPGYSIYQIPEPQGAFLVKNFMDVETQYQLGFQALNDFIHKPYRNNLDGTNGLYFDQVKHQHEQNLQGHQQKERQNIQQEKYESSAGYFFNQKIRMANLGYQYDWPHRSYPKTQVPIPASVSNLTKKAQQLYEKIANTKDIEYNGEAVIVNYYKPRDYMIGHLDDGQQDQINPIFSFCFGLSCVFLLGFPEKEREPIALRLQAGDLLIMSGFSRICYHGVPRIIQDSYKKLLQNEETHIIRQHINQQKDKFHRINGFEEIQNYFAGHRLNINVRQVWSRKNDIEQKQVQ